MVIIILFTIFVTQNTLVIPVDIFFWRVEMSVIVLISLCTFIGIMIGFILVKIFDRQKIGADEEVNPDSSSRNS